MLMVHTIPFGSGDTFGWYFWILVKPRGLALFSVGATYPKISLMETPFGIDSTAPDMDGPVYAFPSPCALMEVHVYLFYSGMDLGF